MNEVDKAVEQAEQEFVEALQSIITKYELSGIASPALTVRKVERNGNVSFQVKRG